MIKWKKKEEETTRRKTSFFESLPRYWIPASRSLFNSSWIWIHGAGKPNPLVVWGDTVQLNYLPPSPLRAHTHSCGLFPALVSIIPLRLPLPFHSALPVLPNFTHPLQLPYFSQTLPLDSSKLCVCVLTLLAPSTCKWLWYLMFEEEKKQRKMKINP